ncbi:MAG: alpha/beta hydrolase [Candidatus Neomarinimicrobiota bacterium]
MAAGPPPPKEINLSAGQVGCFLIHGFTGTPDDLTDLATFLADNNYRTSAPLLAGHGATIEECNLVRAADWLDETEFHFAEFFLGVETAFVLGVNMGAALALHLASLYPVAGVVAVSPRLDPGSPGLRWRLALMAPLTGTVSRERAHNVGPNRQPSPYGNGVYPLQALRAMLTLNRHVRAELPAVTAPTLVMQARNGGSDPSKHARRLLDAISSDQKSFLSYPADGHALPGWAQGGRARAQLLAFLHRHTPAATRALPVHQSR